MCAKFLFLLCIARLSCAVDWDTVTPLDEYIAKADPSYKYAIIATYPEVVDGVTLYLVNMTSQTWFDESFSNHPLWWHIVGVAIPRNLKTFDTGFLFIDGGYNRPNDPPPDASEEAGVIISLFANDTGMIGAYIKQIPNQPIIFVEDELKLERSEDIQIAFTWRLFMNNSSRTHVLNRLPMTKACIRAMDTAATIAKEKVPETNLTKFFVAGASKRGWTTLMVAASDRRVIGIVPMVMSLLNLVENMLHHYQTLNGAYSFALEPYYLEGLTEKLTDPISQELANIEDPFYYRERLTMPKLFVLASGDPFFLLDDSHYFWDGLLGQNYMMMLPNTGHSMAPWYLDIYRSSYVFFKWILGENSFPEMKWTRTAVSSKGIITLSATPAPDIVVGFYAQTLSNNTRRDFRLASIDETGNPSEPGLHPVFFRDENVTQTSLNTWHFERDAVDGEWIAFYIDCFWEPPEYEGHRLRLTTEVHIIPNFMPIEPCIGIKCKGYLI